MSFNNLPSEMEVMGWSPQTLAEYMRSLKFPGCDKVVIRGNITGAQFMQMTECDLQVFPSLYVSIITKIQSDINKGKQNKLFGFKFNAQKNPKQVFVQEEEAWNSDEFDNDSDYEDAAQEEGQGSYICPLPEPPTAAQQDIDESSEEEFDLPSCADIMKPPLNPRATKLQDGHYRGPVPDPPPTERPLKPPNPPRVKYTPLQPFKAPASQTTVHIDRNKKPGKAGPPQKDLTKSKGSTIKASGSFTSKFLHPRTKPADVSNRANKHIPAPPVPTQRNSIPGPRGGFDPSWYGGKVTRHQAEVILRDVNKDGAFVVRDSSKGSTEHPYTLMLLKEEKVYNIKIRSLGNSYSLGNGHKETKSFPGVTEMITHHTHTPLLLVDATDQSSEAQSHCCLLHPAGL